MYKTYIFDLDDTLWHGYWAKMLVGDIKKTDHYTISDELGHNLKLKPGVIGFLRDKSKECNIGFVSRGGLLDIKKERQPSIRVLKEFEILDYFNYCQHTIYKTEDKSIYVIPSGKTLYIDDNENDLKDVKTKHGELIDVINVNAFDF